MSARPSTDPTQTGRDEGPLRAGQAAFEVLSLLDHDRANALRDTDADPFYDNSKFPKFWEALGYAPASEFDEGPHAEGVRPAAAEDDPCRGLVAGDSMNGTGRDLQLRAALLLREEQRKPLPDTGLIHFICESVRLVRENARWMRRTLQIPVPCCPCCGEVDAFGLASHMCGGCYRFVCGDCKVDAAGEPSPCRGICKDCRTKGLDEGALAVRSLKRIEAELKAGDIEEGALDKVEALADSILRGLTGG
jgi:hypothetical protein